MNNAKAVLVVKFKSEHSPEKLMEAINNYLETFRNVPGLIQKYYLAEEETHLASGFYIFDSRESRDAYWNSDLAKKVPSIFGVVIETIRVEKYDIPMILND